MEFALKIQHALQSIRNPFLDTLMSLVTKLGEEIIIFGVICILFWCLNKDMAYGLGFTFFGSGILAQGMKVGFTVERPFVLDNTLKPVDSAIENATGYSFPSGHTQASGSLFGYIAFTVKKTWARALLILAVLLVGFSRMYLGVHTVYDVCVSLIISLVIAFVITKFGKIMLDEKNAHAVAIALAAGSVLLCIFSLVMAAIGHAEWSQINDCFKSGGAGLGFALGYYLEKRYIRFNPKNGSLPFHIIKLAIGIGIAFGLKSGIKLISEGNLAIDLIRYFLTVLWVVAIYPYLFTKFLNRKGKRLKHT